MNRVVLLLNTGILVVTFLLAMSATDSQIGLLKSASGMPMRPVRPHTASDPSMAYLRVVQTLDSVLPRGAKVHASQLASIHEAVQRYYYTVREGVLESLGHSGDGDAREAAALRSKEAREQVERTLASSFSDPTVLRRLTTEVTKSCY